ncbi:MAG: YIP1 family protein [Deltaproteobacteria bacterium]|nr:YIP1 family protein [Deltaproteobacteria bacterium]
MAIDLAPLFQRVYSLLASPARTWHTIEREPDPGRLMITRYVLLLAIVPALCSFLGGWIAGGRFWFSLVLSAIRLAIFVGSVYLLGLAVNAMAPSFGARRDKDNAFKTAAYASTPLWVAGVLTIVPILTALAALLGFGLAVYHFQIGCRFVMETPERKAWAFSCVSVGVWFGMILIAMLILYPVLVFLFTPMLVFGPIPLPAPATSGA